MCLQPGEEIGEEVHSNVDQFFRIEQGEAKLAAGEVGRHDAQAFGPKSTSTLARRNPDWQHCLHAKGGA
jgi:hypothetical protein